MEGIKPGVATGRRSVFLHPLPPTPALVSPSRQAEYRRHRDSHSQNGRPCNGPNPKLPAGRGHFMKPATYDPTNIVCGAFFILTGLVFGWQSLQVELGSWLRIGPGGLPLALSLLL